MKNILILLFILIAGNIKAQQLPVFSHYYVNPFIENPAYAGMQTSFVNTYFHFREQWVDIPDAPVTALFSIDGPVKSKKIGLGFAYESDKSNLLNSTTIKGTYRYLFQLNPNQFISLGLTPKIHQYGIQFDKIITKNMNDPSLFDHYENATTFNADFGFLYGLQRFKIGFTAKNLVNNHFNISNDATYKDLNFQLIRHFVIIAGYRFNLKKDILYFDPVFTVRNVQGLPIQYEGGGYFNYKNSFWLGGLYRQNSAIAISSGLVANNKLTIGYAYELPIGDIANYTSGSHELVIGFRLKGLKSTESNKPLKLVTKLVKSQSEKIDNLKSENEKLANENVIQKEILEKTNESLVGMKEEIERLKNQQVTLNDSILNNLIKGIKVTGDEVEKEEANPENAYYVVLASYATIDGAKNFQQILKRELSLDTKVIPSRTGKYYFIYSSSLNSHDDAKSEIKKLIKMGVEKLTNGSIWIYEKK